LLFAFSPLVGDQTAALRFLLNTYAGGKYKTGDDEQAHFITFSVVEWIDALTRNEYKDIITESLAYCIKEKGLRLHAWIIMPNHVHLIMSARRGFMISHILRDLKKFTSKQIYNAILANPKKSRKEWLICMFKRAGKRNSNNRDFQFWQQDNHPIELSNVERPRLVSDQRV